jgi:hypothetical protein
LYLTPLLQFLSTAVLRIEGTARVEVSDFA